MKNKEQPDNAMDRPADNGQSRRSAVCPKCKHKHKNDGSCTCGCKECVR